MKIRNRGIVAAFATVATAALLSVGVAPVQAATQTVTI
jgi:hypothetical protein